MHHIFAVTVLCLAVTTATAGSLTPPGAPAPTMKTLDEVEARTPISPDDLPLLISSSGSYYLTANLSINVADTTGIIVSAPNVTIDLNGFTLTGPGNTVGAFGAGIATMAPTETITIKNGTISQWRLAGINTIDAQSASITDVSALKNGGAGITIASGLVRHCTASENLGDGINISGSSDSLIAGNRCTANGKYGILANSGAKVVISNNSSSYNSISGIASFFSRSNIINNICERNAVDGITATATSGHVEGNILASNTQYGYYGSSGFLFADSSLIVRNSAYNNLINNYIFASTSSYGPIVDISAGGTIASQHPLANLSK